MQQLTRARQRKAPAAAARLNSDMPPEPRYGFSGRSYELLQLERHLLHHQLVIISGFGGIGKTALVRETADWLTRTGMYHGACFVSFEHGGDAAVLLSALGSFLGIYDGCYNPNDVQAALAHLQSTIKAHPTLIVADNLESILLGGEAPLDAAARAQLWSVLLELAKLHAGVLLTTRDTNFGDERMARGERVAYLRLHGLFPDDAYALATRLLTSLGVERTRAPYKDLCDLLIQLDYYPLSIQLVLPALRTIPLATIRADFAALLPKFTDDTETGHNRSLLASLDYSLRRLSVEQRSLLPRLALFEGGAKEDDLLAITEIPKSEWVTLRPALEQAALLTPERVGNYAAPFLHFHPVLAPYLRSQPGADDTALRDRYARRYYAVANNLYQEDDSYPQPVRSLVQKELPNLRRALELLLATGDLDTASEMAEGIAKFFDYFGLLRERDELRRRLNAAVAKNVPAGNGLTQAEWLRESGLGDDEWQRGNLRDASTRFTALLARIEARPADTPLGSGSYEHCQTLVRLARCLRSGGQPAAAEGRLREAHTVIDALIKQQPENQSYIRQHGVLMTDLGNALSEQGKYTLAKEAYEDALKINTQIGELRNQAAVFGQLGKLALFQRDYVEATSRYTTALHHFQALSEPAMEAVAWHQLGKIAEEQKDWAEAERSYRKSLAIEEQLGDTARVAMTCNQLAFVAENTGRSAEAERWYKRALELFEQAFPGGFVKGRTLSNLANLLVNEIRAGRAGTARLTEAKRYAEQALTMKETLDASSEIWITLNTLARVAEMEGRAEAAREYHRRERETFAAFEGNRYYIDHQYGQLINAIATAEGNAQVRAIVEAALPEFEKLGWHIADAARRIWTGERDWQSLAGDLDKEKALLILRVLETIAQPMAVPAQPTPEEGGEEHPE